MVSHHPGIECLAAADIVVGGSGYNIVYESASVGVPLVGLAFSRLYIGEAHRRYRQENRAGKGYMVRDIDDAIATVSILLEQVERTKPLSVPSYLMAQSKRCIRLK